MEKECEYLLSYISNTLSESDKEIFEVHMQTCDSCREDYKELSESWEALQFDFEDQDVPKSLKKEVFSFIFMDDDKEQKLSVTDKLVAWKNDLKSQFRPLTSSLIIMLLIVTTILMYVNSWSGNEVQDASSRQAEIITSLQLKTDDAQMNEASGYAYVVQQDDAKKLIIQVDGLPKLEGTETYQVWLLKDSQRLNAGIFNTNETGSGVLVHTLPKEESFDQIGITKEPKLNNTQPEGIKMVGSQ